MEDTLLKIAKADSVSGCETSAVKQADKIMSEFSETNMDCNGNLIACFGNKTDSKFNILLDAHIDQIGFVVTYIDSKGFVKVSGCGGIDRRVLAGSPIKIFGKKEIMSVVCCLPPHLTDGGESKAVDSDSIWLDTGSMSKDEVCNVISLGDRAVLWAVPHKLMNNRITALALDNCAGVTAVIEVAKRLSAENLKCTVTCLLSSQEEIGCLGAKTGAYAINPNEAIAVDVSFGNQPGVDEYSSGKLGNGTMIGVSPILNKEMSKKLFEIAKENHILFQTEVMGGKTGTTADVISTTRCGVPTALLSIPLRNMHTGAEVIDMTDIEATVQLICSYVKQRSDML